MRTLCGLLTVLLVLGPVGMGMMFTVDAPFFENVTFTDNDNDPAPFDDHGTRSAPEEDPQYINLYFHRNSPVNPGVQVMNTTDLFRFINPGSVDSDTTFFLEEPLQDDFWVTDPQGSPGMMAHVVLSGLSGDSVTFTVTDNEGGTEVGAATYVFPNIHASTPVDVIIPFNLQFNHNYTFPAGHSVVLTASFTGNAQMLFDHDTTISYLRLYCTPVTDIEVGTYNYQGALTQTFYSNNIDFPTNRRVVNVEGEITDVFRKWDGKYIREVDIEILKGGETVEQDNASLDKDTWWYEYAWKWDKGVPEAGEYTVIITVTDEQDHVFTARNTFNMSQYGVLLTSTDQKGGEGAFGSDVDQAERKVIQYATTIYKINVRNVGSFPTIVDLSTTGKSGWDWWLEGDNLTANDKSKSDTVLSIEAGGYREIGLVVDSKDNLLHKTATIPVTAVCSEDTGEVSILDTFTEVVVKYDVVMKFTDGTKTKEESGEIGDSFTYEFTITNAGGANDNISISIGTLPTGWDETLVSEGDDLKFNHPVYGKYYVFLTTGDTSQVLTLTLSTGDTGGDLEVEIKITARSEGSKAQDPTQIVSDEITTVTTLSSGIELVVDDDPEKETDPDEDENFKLKLINPGSQSADYTVTLTLEGDSEGWSDEDISFDSNNNVDENQYTLGGGDSTSFFVWVNPTFDVEAGNYTINIHAERDDDPENRYVDKNVFIHVLEYYSIVVTSSLELEDEADPGDDVEYLVTIKNEGNTAERVTILVDKPSEWTVDFGNASSEWSKEIEPGDTEDVRIVLGIPDSADGDETVDITISVVPATSDPVQVLTHTKINADWYQPIILLAVPLLLFIVIIVMVIVIFRRR